MSTESIRTKAVRNLSGLLEAFLRAVRAEALSGLRFTSVYYRRPELAGAAGLGGVRLRGESNISDLSPLPARCRRNGLGRDRVLSSIDELLGGVAHVTRAGPSAKRLMDDTCLTHVLYLSSVCPENGFVDDPVAAWRRVAIGRFCDLVRGHRRSAEL